jgi:hypothetical protein
VNGGSFGDTPDEGGLRTGKGAETRLLERHVAPLSSRAPDSTAEYSPIQDVIVAEKLLPNRMNPIRTGPRIRV